MMEYWALKRIFPFMNTFHLLVKKSVVNISLPHFSRTHYSIVPVFQSRLGGMSEAN